MPGQHLAANLRVPGFIRANQAKRSQSEEKDKATDSEN